MSYGVLYFCRSFYGLYLLFPPLLGGRVTAAGYWIIYIGHLGLLQVGERWLLKTPPTMTGCDNASHFGGFALGSLLAVVYKRGLFTWIATGQVSVAGTFLLARWLRDFVKDP